MGIFNKEKLKKLTLADLQAILTYYTTQPPTTQYLSVEGREISASEDAVAEWKERERRVEDVRDAIDAKFKRLVY